MPRAEGVRPTRHIPSEDDRRPTLPAPPPPTPSEDERPARRDDEEPAHDPKVDFSVDVSFSCYV